VNGAFQHHRGSSFPIRRAHIKPYSRDQVS
jgi:hypothetical protein